MTDYKKTSCPACRVVLYQDNLDLHMYRVHSMNTVTDDIKVREAIKRVRSFSTWLHHVSQEHWDLSPELQDEWLAVLGDPLGCPYGAEGHDYTDHLYQSDHVVSTPTIVSRLASRWYTWRWAR